MNTTTTLRTITVSAAAIAVLGLAGTATAADLSTVDHHQAVAAVAASDTRPFAPLDQPTGTNPATYPNDPEQVTTQSLSGPAVGVGGTAILLLGAGVFYAIKKANHRFGWMLCSFALGVLLAGGALGAMTQTAVSSVVTSVASFGGGLS
ncbi:hypothetical protein ACIO6U_28250 [Streptomyces sp. NPDC087422]|uniref:hypothetical protein n=1 Tax=Streptomyces sp. NPDC087422 TaxID=3365786 RepID=UPI0037FC86EE